MPQPDARHPLAARGRHLHREREQHRLEGHDVRHPRAARRQRPGQGARQPQVQDGREHQGVDGEGEGCQVQPELSGRGGQGVDTREDKG